MFESTKPLFRLAGFFLTAILFVFIGIGFSYIRMPVLSFLEPIQNVVGNVTHAGRGFINNLYHLKSLESEYKRIRGENIRLKNIVIEMEEFKIENERLRKMLNFETGSEYVLLAAGVVGRDLHPMRKTLWINKGQLDGIEPKMTVVVSDGLVGRVLKVGPNVSQVIMIADVDSRVSALIQNTREQGIVKGSADGRVFFDYLKQSANIAVNDLVISSGMGGVYMKGLVVGRVRKIELDQAGIFQVATIHPAVSFDKIEEVFVVLREK